MVFMPLDDPTYFARSVVADLGFGRSLTIVHGIIPQSANVFLSALL